MILTVTLNPCIDLLLGTRGLLPYDTNRVVTREEDAGGKLSLIHISEPTRPY